jgi:hypothetical protein
MTKALDWHDSVPELVFAGVGMVSLGACIRGFLCSATCSAHVCVIVESNIGGYGASGIGYSATRSATASSP